MKDWNIILATIVIFGAGVVTGGLLVSHVTHVSPSRPVSELKPAGTANEVPGPLRAQVLSKQFVQKLNDKLDLTQQQRQQIQKIIAQGQQKTRDLWKLVGPDFQLIWRDTRQQIRQVLTPEQKKEFETLMKQQRRPMSTNAPPARLPSTNLPPVQPSAPPTNAPTV